MYLTNNSGVAFRLFRRRIRSRPSGAGAVSAIPRPQASTYILMHCSPVVDGDCLGKSISGVAAEMYNPTAAYICPTADTVRSFGPRSTTTQ